MASPQHHYRYPYEHRDPRDLVRHAHPEQSTSRRNDVALPSIGQVFPEFSSRTHYSASSPTEASFSGVTSPDYIHSRSPTHQKWPRPSYEYEKDVPRVWNGSNDSHEDNYRRRSPPRALWNRSPPGSPAARNGALPLIATLEPREQMERRPTLPRLEFERSTNEAHRFRSRLEDDYVQETRRPSMASNYGHVSDREPAVYEQAGFGHQMHRPSRGHSLSVGSIVHPPRERTPFSPVPYGTRYHHEPYMRVGEFGTSMHGDNRQRKRRGNLPKETTDKLRSWFHAHLHHPYPSEEEKQSLMRQTGLQINQISNWFINARRRQLPAIMNNAHAESNARAIRGSSGGLLASTERLEYDSDVKQYDSDTKPLSDGEVGSYHDMEINRRRVDKNGRGSI